MASKQIWRHEVTYHPENVQDKSSANSPDIRVYLPDTLEKLGLGVGDDIVLEEKQSDHGPYLLGQIPRGEYPSDVIYTIFSDGSNRQRITIPADSVPKFIEYDGEDVLVVEVNAVEAEFRVYKNDDYPDRLDDFDDDNTPRLGTPVIVALAAAAQNRETESLRAGFGEDIGDEPPQQRNSLASVLGLDELF